MVSSAHATVLLSPSTTTPVVGLEDQYNFGIDATIPGGTFNSQAFSDNSGGPGQTFTTPATGNFTLGAFSFKGAATGSSNVGGFAAGTTWGIRVSSVTGGALAPILTVTGIPSPATLAGDEWLTWTFSGADLLTLQPSKLYAVDVFSSAGYYGFDAAVDPNSYSGGVAFNSTSAARSFNNTSIQDRGYDRTFAADLTVVPEPAAATLLVAGLGLLGMRRRR
ncbi:MAG: hypothetical protein JWL90_466 [Chthoniobacteraceae bacterium]|nr:hypothetical protein [Chthoniobacteraceae bacterium]